MNYPLLVIALLIDLIFPILTWKAGLPESSRFLSQFILLWLVLRGLAHFFRRHRPPISFWLIAFLSLAGISIAMLNGQAPGVTIWGWWLMFKYPLLGLYARGQVPWKQNSALWILRISTAILLLETAVQICQYLAGEPTGDDLAGTFGFHGTGHMVIFLLLALAFSLGHWIATGEFSWVVLALFPGLVSSVLGEMKIFPFAILFMSALALALKFGRDRKLAPAVLYLLIVAAGLTGFSRAYDSFIPGYTFASFLKIDTVTEYLSSVSDDDNGRIDPGRNYVLAYIWKYLRTDPLSMAFGKGLGACTESKTLGFEGILISRGELRGYRGSSLTVILGELGILGLAFLFGAIVTLIRKFWRAARAPIPHADAGILYGLILYTALLPLWLWYSPSWTSPVAMLIYWVTIGSLSATPPLSDTDPISLRYFWAQVKSRSPQFGS